MFTGKPLTAQDKARNLRIASFATNPQLAPIFTQLLGPDLVDQLHGSRGSATIFANQLHTALRTSMDPVTGRIGMSGASAGQISQSVYSQLFGDNYNQQIMQGMSAGQAGILAGELQTRGLLGVPVGSLSLAERRLAVADNLTDADFRRIASNTKEIKAITDAGQTPAADMLEAATNNVRKSYEKLKDTNLNMTNDDVTKLDGGEDILRTGDATRISSRLKNLAGAVKAMRDIFGDSGNPNAPMREIVDGLNQLTQGGLATMSSSDLEMTVRKTQAIAKQTGIGIAGIQALITNNTALGDQFGLDRSFSVTAGQQAAMFGAGAGNTLNLGSGAYGQRTIEQITVADSQLRMAAAASPVANQMNTALRLADEGMLTPKAGSQLEKYLTAARSGNQDFNYAMSNQQFLQMLKDSDDTLNDGTVMAIFHNRTGNQEFGLKYDTAGLVRKAMAKESASRYYGKQVSGDLLGVMTNSKIFDVLKAEGVVSTNDEFLSMADTLGLTIANQTLNLSAKDLTGTKADRNKAMGGVVRESLRQSIAARMPNADAATVDAVVQKVEQQFGNAGGMSGVGATAYASLDTMAATDPQAQSALGWHAMHSKAAHDAFATQQKQATITALMTSAYAGVGTAKPIQRLIDAIQTTGPEGITQDTISKLMGGVSQEQLKAIDPEGTLTQALQLSSANNKLDISKQADFEQMQFNANVVKGLLRGGDSAATTLTTYKDSQLLLSRPDLQAKLEQAAKDDSKLLQNLQAIVPLWSSTVTRDDITAVSDAYSVADKRLTEDPESKIDLTKTAVQSAVKYATEQAQAMLQDEFAMQHIGQGGMALLDSVVNDNQQLQKMAVDKNITVAELVNTDAEAKAIFLRSKSNWTDVKTRLDRGASDNAPQTQAEINALKLRRDAETKGGTSEEQLENIMQGLFDVVAPEHRGQVDNTVTEDRLHKAMASDTRRNAMAMATSARHQILQMAIDKQVYAGKTKVSELTATERANADDILSGMALPDSERLNLDELKRQSQLLDSGIDRADGVDTEALIKAIETIPVALKDQEEQKLNVNVTGKLVDEEGGVWSIMTDAVQAIKSLV
jgi:hypothetical protein